MVAIGNFLFKYRNAILPILFLGIFIPSPAIFYNPIYALVFGLAIALSGQLARIVTIGLVYIIRGGRDGKVYAEELVTSGIFGHARNPLYLGNVLVGIGMGLASNSLVFFLIITPTIIFFYQAIIRAEENFLENKFGQVFIAYTHRVDRWLPSVMNLSETFRSHSFAWRRVILKEYNSTFSGITLGLLLIAKALYSAPEQFPSPRNTYITLLEVWIVIAVVYLFVKFLKKTHRLKPN